MRKIEQEMLAAFNSNTDFHKGNTDVISTSKRTSVRLHGNLICVKDLKTGNISYSNCGWFTNTTKSRLNALGANIKQVKYQWMQGNKPFHSKNLTW